MSERPIARCPPVSPRRPGPTAGFLNATKHREDRATIKESAARPG